MIPPAIPIEPSSLNVYTPPRFPCRLLGPPRFFFSALLEGSPPEAQVTLQSVAFFHLVPKLLPPPFTRFFSCANIFLWVPLTSHEPSFHPKVTLTLWPPFGFPPPLSPDLSRSACVLDPLLQLYTPAGTTRTALIDFHVPLWTPAYSFPHSFFLPPSADINRTPPPQTVPAFSPDPSHRETSHHMANLPSTRLLEYSSSPL